MSTPSKRPSSRASSEAATPSRRTRSSQQVVVPETPQQSSGTPSNGINRFSNLIYVLSTTRFKSLSKHLQMYIGFML